MRASTCALLAAAAQLACLFRASAVAALSPEVKAPSGTYRGTAHDGVDAFLGVRFGRAPVGPLRFAPPVPPPDVPHENVLDATKQPPGCPQHCGLPPGVCPASFSEDCLFLNVWRPANVTGSLAPVLLFIHGGGFEQGGAGVPLYDGTPLARKGVVVASMQYRLGVLGSFRVASEYGDASSPPGDGQYAFLDQRLAMQWVQRNIASFGGDPKTVTVFGQSAGAISVTYHVTADASQGLFARAIVESNPIGLRLREPKETAELGQRVVDAAGCAKAQDVSSCLRGVNAFDLMDAAKKAALERPGSLGYDFILPWVPVADGNDDNTTALQPFNALISDEGAGRVPLIMGVSSEDMRVFVYEGLRCASIDDVQTGKCMKLRESEYYAIVRAFTPGERAFREALQEYKPETPDEKYKDVLSRLGNDLLFTCPVRALARAAASASAVDPSRHPIQMYIYSHVWSFEGWGDVYSAACDGHACHGGELPFVFGGTETLAGFQPSADERSMGEEASDLWVSFARHGSAWRGYGRDGGVLVMDRNATTPRFPMVAGWRDAYCDFWEEGVGLEATWPLPKGGAQGRRAV